MDDERLKRGGTVLTQQYFDELLERVREVSEETGMIVDVSDCVLEIDEYYEDRKWVNKYFVGNVIGRSEIKLTEREQEVGMVPKWVSAEEIKGIFSKYESYADTDEMRRGMYLREYTALTELLSGSFPAHG